MPDAAPTTARIEDSRPPGPRATLPGLRLLRLLRARRRGMLGTLVDLKAAYGDVVFFRTFGRPFCLVSDPELIRQILVKDHAQFTKSRTLAGAKAVLGEGLLTSEGDLHRRQRRTIQPVFHARQVRAYAGDFVALARRTSGEWREGEAIGVHAEMTRLTLRVVVKALFGAELEEEAGQVGHDMAVVVSMFERARNPLAPLLNRLPLPSNRRFREALARVDALIAEMTAARRALPAEQAAERFDLLSLLLLARDDDGGGAAMSDRQVRDEAVTLFMAGHETTANALTWTWLLLAEHPEAEAALHAELDAVLAGRDATAEEVPRLAYTRAVIAESMRLRPPAWVVAREPVGP